MKYTIELTPEQDAGVTAAREFAATVDGHSYADNQEYLQARNSDMADSYVKQWNPETPEGLANRLAVAEDQAAIAKARALEEADKAEKAAAELAATKEQVAVLEESVAASARSVADVIKNL